MMTDWEKIARDLFDLLDEIDTTDDIAKADDDFFRRRVRYIHSQRFKYATTDGYTVTFKTGPFH